MRSMLPVFDSFPHGLQVLPALFAAAADVFMNVIQFSESLFPSLFSGLPYAPDVCFGLVSELGVAAVYLKE